MGFLDEKRKELEGVFQPMPPLFPQIDWSNPPKSAMAEHVEKNLASEFLKRLQLWIDEFDSDLDQEHEVGVRLVSFGESVIFHLESMGYFNPSLISFCGKLDDGSPVALVQHVSQISILLMSLKRKNPEEPKQPVGFHAIRSDQPANPERKPEQPR